MGLLRKVSAPCAARVRRAGYPVGCRDIERQVTAVCPLHGVRLQGRNDPESGLGPRRFHISYVGFVDPAGGSGGNPK
jgi:hypothetical protein